MTETVRAFIAVELPPEVNEALASVVASLRDARIAGLRPVNPHGIHLTLKFLGDVARAQTDLIVHELQPVLRVARPFAVELGETGVFPNRREPRVLWVGIAGNLERLGDLRLRIDDAMAGLGLARERRRFNPHLTLARLRDRADVRDRRKAAAALALAPVVSGLGFDIGAVSLMRSELRPEGATYRRLALIPLAGGDANPQPE